MYKRIMLCAPRSGSGKTTLMIALLAALKRCGIDISSFKCGPDYIDPMFHEKVIGVPSKNLDMFFSGKDGVLELLSDNQSDNSYALIEGAMGIYDGLGGISSQMSAYDTALVSKTPILLILDAAGVGRTIISIIKGILSDDTEGLIFGVILNKISKSFYEQIAPVIQEETKIECLGYFPKTEEAVFESRHLGLKLPDEIKDYQERISNLADTALKTIDIDRIIAKMAETVDVSFKSEKQEVYRASNDLKMAVAMDEAFCFYYKDNLKELENRNVTIIPFSPIRDRKLPEGIDAIYLGGGYPELKLKELATNTDMLEAINEAYKDNIPMLAECGGFMYLHDEIKGEDDSIYKMVGAIAGACYNTYKLGRFGYIDLYLNDNQIIKAHEFHYYDSENAGSDIRAKKPLGKREWMCMHKSKRQMLGFAHLYYSSCPDFLNEFVQQMEEYHREKNI